MSQLLLHGPARIEEGAGRMRALLAHEDREQLLVGQRPRAVALEPFAGHQGAARPRRVRPAPPFAGSWSIHSSVHHVPGGRHAVDAPAVRVRRVGPGEDRGPDRDARSLPWSAPQRVAVRRPLTVSGRRACRQTIYGAGDEDRCLATGNDTDGGYS